MVVKSWFGYAPPQSTQATPKACSERFQRRGLLECHDRARVSFSLVDFYHREGRLIGVDTLKLSFAESAEVLREIVPLVNAGVLTPPELDSIAIEQAPRAYQAVLDGTARRKQVLRF